MRDAFICDAIRTPFGRYGGALSSVRPDDLAAVPLRALLARNAALDPGAIDDVILGCANQAGEDNRNVARMAVLLAGLPRIGARRDDQPSCAGPSPVCDRDRSADDPHRRRPRSVAGGGVESMSRAPYVLSKSAAPFGRDVQLYDTTIGWRFVNALFKKQYGVDSMPETAENVATDFRISRADQDRFALRSQERALAAQASGVFAAEITPVVVPGKKGEAQSVDRDEHPRATSLEALARLATPFRDGGTVTAGNASGINDGAAAVLLASAEAICRFGLMSRARVVGAAVAGVSPRIMGVGPVPATRKLLARLGWSLAALDVIELNEAFAAQALAVLRELGIADGASHVSPNGGAIALGHPLGASGARLATTALNQLERMGGRKALCTMCIGVGQGIALALERS